MSEPAIYLATLMLLLGSFAGCSRNETPITPIEPQGRVEHPSAVVTIVDRAEYDAALVSLQGKVVLVDCWASWCVPCLAQLPHTMKLAEQHASEGLAVVTLNFDDASKVEQVAKILTAKGGAKSGAHFLSKQGSGTKSMEEFEILSGALPHYKLYDRAGKLRRTFELDPMAETQFTLADIDAAVAELLHAAN